VLPVPSPEHPARPSAVIVIPARYESSRFPGKPLARIAGRPMIEHVYERARRAAGVDRVLVATDDRRIASAVEAFGGEAVMTRSDHATGTDRLAEVADGLTCDIVINIQGDEPLLEPAMVRQVLEALTGDAAAVMGSLRTRLVDRAEYLDPNVVKVAVDRHDAALYFSRAPIPFVRETGTAGAPPHAFRHIGVYSYRRAFLPVFRSLAPTPLETLERLEQLRALEHGYRIRVTETTYRSIGVDTPADLAHVEQLLAARAQAAPAG
jgi:3-deoxy-manno-octulosonate cytidylyltransferase (CMP-KDO synthetase)